MRYPVCPCAMHNRAVASEAQRRKRGRKMAICACGMRERCAHLMHVFPRVILFVEDCQQGSSLPPGLVLRSSLSRAAKPAQAARIA